MASAGARAYNGGLAAEPPAGTRGRAPGQGVRGQSPPPEAVNVLTVESQADEQNLSHSAVHTGVNHKAFWESKFQLTGMFTAQIMSMEAVRNVRLKFKNICLSRLGGGPLDIFLQN